jgi:AcrR family transcriptional regulator
MGCPRPGGRSARVREVVFTAASQLIVEKGIHGVGIPDVAERAGVAVTSLYRRWGDIAGLLIDLAISELSRDYPLADTGSLRGDLKAWATNAARVIGSEEGSLLFKVFLATAPRGRQKRVPRQLVATSRSVEIERVLARARTRGENTPTVEDLTDFVLGPIYFHALFGSPVDERYANYLVDRLLA